MMILWLFYVRKLAFKVTYLILLWDFNSKFFLCLLAQQKLAVGIKTNLIPDFVANYVVKHNKKLALDVVDLKKKIVTQLSK